MDGNVSVLLRRLDMLEEAIRRRSPWEDIEFVYDQVRSSAERLAGTRDRLVDRLRQEQETSAERE